MEKKPVNALIDVDFEPYWFNSVDYIEKTSKNEGVTYFYKRDAAQLFIRFHKIDNEWVSPARAPFGGLEISKQTDIKTAYDFVKEIIEEAKNEHVQKIRISVFPECYNITNADLIDEVLIHAGFQVSITELNFHLSTTSGDFESFIHVSENRRLRKAKQAGFECSIDTNPDLEYIHKLISDCRNRKGHPLSMNLIEFKKMFHDFPERYILFVVKDKELIIAAAIGVIVRSDIMYNFLPADHEDYLNYSPMVLLNEGIYNYCRVGGYKLYDLGIATSGGIRNEGLIKFKEHLGGEMSHKYTYELQIDTLS